MPTVSSRTLRIGSSRKLIRIARRGLSALLSRFSPGGALRVFLQIPDQPGGFLGAQPTVGSPVTARAGQQPRFSVPAKPLRPVADAFLADGLASGIGDSLQDHP